MSPVTVIAAAVALLATLSSAGAQTAVEFSESERAAIVSHGPWPPATSPDPSNRVSGNAKAIALGRRLFFDKGLSKDGGRACATCHDPAKTFADGRPRSMGRQVLDRNTIALANLRLNRWFGWSGAADNLWAQSIRPILDPKELGLTPESVRAHVASIPALAHAYARLFGSRPAKENAELVLVNVAKALAAFQETIATSRTPFDEFRDALANGDRKAAVRYPLAAQRGLKIFIGKGNCSACHVGPNFTSGEFEDVGVPYFAEKGRVDQGRYGGIAALLASPFNLLGKYNDAPAKANGVPTTYVEQLHRNWGAFRVPSLRNVALTAPYMHNGSLATLADVVRHYSEVDEDRLHADQGTSLLRPLGLSSEERTDLAAFLRTLTSKVAASRTAGTP
jgi:cytochrome c peroxidase